MKTTIGRIGDQGLLPAGASSAQSRKDNSSTSGNLTDLRSDETREAKRGSAGLFRALFSMFVGDRALPRSTIVSSFFINFLGLALPLVLLQIYDRILINQSVATLTYLLLGLASAIIIEAALKIIRAYLMSWTATKQGYQSMAQAVKNVVRVPAKRFEQEPASVWMDRLESLDQYNSFSAGQSRLILLDLPFVAIYLAVILVVAAPLVLTLVALVSLFFVLVVMRAKALRQVLAERSSHNHRRDSYIAETLGGIETIKIMAMEPQMQRRFERLQQKNSAISHRSISLSNELQIYSHMIANIVLITIVSVGALMVIKGIISVGSLACCTLLTSRVMQPAVRGVQVLMELETAQLARETADQLFALPVSNADRKRPACRGEIDLKNAGFAYGGSDKPVLKDINLHADPGEILGISGEHASGKSTLIKLICGELAPTRGTCRIDGKSISDEANADLAEAIVLVSQESAIFDGTIMDNITMFQNRSANVQNARQAVQLIELEDDIHRLPQGYDTPIGQGVAEALPRGMVQRIIIARALAQRPKILLFDEANSMLDMPSDRALRRGLRRLKGLTTTLLMSNRQSLLAIADRRYVLQAGSLLEAADDPKISQEGPTTVRAAVNHG